MHQPLPISHKVSVGISDSEIIHELRLISKHHRLDHAITPIRAANPSAHLECTGLDPFAIGLQRSPSQAATRKQADETSPGHLSPTDTVNGRTHAGDVGVKKVADGRLHQGIHARFDAGLGQPGHEPGQLSRGVWRWWGC